MWICQESWCKHVAESKNRRSIPAVSTLREQSHSYPRPSVSGEGKGDLFQIQVWGKWEGEMELWEEMGGCLLRVVGGWRRDGWMRWCGYPFPHSAKVQPLLSPAGCFSCFQQFPNGNCGLHQCTGLEISVREGEDMCSPWCMQTTSHHQTCMVECPGRPSASSVHGGSQGSCSLLCLDLA